MKDLVMPASYFETLGPTEQRDIKTAFRLGHTITRKLLIYPAAHLRLWGSLVMAKWDVLMAPIQKSPVIDALMVLGPIPVISSIILAGIPAYIISQRTARATHRFNEILNPETTYAKLTLDEIIDRRVKLGGTMVGIGNGILIPTLVGSAYIALSPQPANLITPLAPVAVGIMTSGIALLGFYNFMWRRSMRDLRDEIQNLAGAINVDEDVGRPKIPDRTNIDKPFQI